MTEIPEDAIKAARECHDKIMYYAEGRGITEAHVIYTIASTIMAERERIAELLKDPFAVRLNYLRGDISAQSIIEEAVKEEREKNTAVILPKSFGDKYKNLMFEMAVLNRGMKFEVQE